MFNPQSHKPEVSTRALVFRQALAAAFKSLRQSIPAAPESLPALLAACDQESSVHRPECREALTEIRARLFQISGREAEAEAFWQEGLAGALFAARVARLNQASVAESFMGALLHRAGEALALKILARVERGGRGGRGGGARRGGGAGRAAGRG